MKFRTVVFNTFITLSLSQLAHAKDISDRKITDLLNSIPNKNISIKNGPCFDNIGNFICGCQVEAGSGICLDIKKPKPTRPTKKHSGTPASY